MVGALTFTISAVHDDAFYADLARQMRECPDIDRVYVKDPSGILTAERARTLLPAVKAELGITPLELHSHATIGLSPLTYSIAPELGVEVVQTGCGVLGNGTSLPEVRRTVANLREMGHRVDIDDRVLGLACEFVDRLADAEELPPGKPQDFDAAFLHHQIAGGVMTTTRRQLREIGMEDRFDSVVDEVGRVRADLGYPIMVTPFPQMIVSQALFNVIGERYANVPDQVIRYVLGSFGRPTAPIDPEVHDRILDRPRARELVAEPEPPTPAELRRQFGRGDQRRGAAAARAHARRAGRRHARRRTGPRPLQPGPRPRPRPAPRAGGTEDRARPGRGQVRPAPVRAPSRRRESTVPEPDPAVLDRLRRVRGFVLDMDGTLVLGDRNNKGLRPLPGAEPLFAALTDLGLPFRIFTNGTTRTPLQYAHALQAVGFPVPDDGVLTPTSSAIDVLRRHGHRRVMVLGGKGITEPLEAAGLEALPPLRGTRADAVFAGWFRQELTFDALEAACDAVLAGAQFYSASQALFFATAEGRQLGTSRAIAAVVRDITGCRVTVVGKPSRQRCARPHAGSDCPPPRSPWSATTPSSRCRWRTGAARWLSPSTRESGTHGHSPICPTKCGPTSTCRTSGSWPSSSCRLHRS